MRFANQKLSPFKKTGKICRAGQVKTQFNYLIQSQKFYMHYNNAIYMGGMVSYKRNGKGIMLLDQQTSGITQYNFDSLTGHNIFFRQNSIFSFLQIKKGSYQIAIRTGQIIIKLPFYQHENLLNGNGVLIDYQNYKLYHLLYQNGVLVKKIAESNQHIMDQVIKQNLKNLIDRKHENAFKFRFNFDGQINIVKERKKFSIGFIDKRYNIEGVGFKLRVNQQTVQNFSIPLEIKCIERGNYEKNRLQNFGQRYFSNGNLYIGQFVDDCFQGQGLLVYPQTEKWIHGYFQGEKLKKMLTMSIKDENNEKNSIKSQDCLQLIHEHNVKNWMNVDIQLFQWAKLIEKVHRAQQFKVTDIVIQSAKVNNEEQMRLIQIQNHFSFETQNEQIDKVILKQQALNRKSPQKIKINERTKYIPKILEIQPRSIENEQYWSVQYENKLKCQTPSNISRKYFTRANLNTIYSSLQKSKQRKRISTSKYSPAKRYLNQLNDSR